MRDEDRLDAAALAAAISRAARNRNATVAVAESLTSGSVGSRLGAAEASSEWFLGGVIAYAPAVKFGLLGVDRGAVVTARCAGQMARGVARLLGADVSVALTGVGGPGPEEGKRSGTVFIAVCRDGDETVKEHLFDGDPGEVVRLATLEALRMLRGSLSNPVRSRSDIDAGLEV